MEGGPTRHASGEEVRWSRKVSTCQVPEMDMGEIESPLEGNQRWGRKGADMRATAQGAEQFLSNRLAIRHLAYIHRLVPH